MILSRVDEELTHEKAVRIRSAVEEAKNTADTKAREIIASAIQRNAADTFPKPRFPSFPFLMKK